MSLKVPDKKTFVERYVLNPTGHYKVKPKPPENYVPPKRNWRHDPEKHQDENGNTPEIHPTPPERIELCRPNHGNGLRSLGGHVPEFASETGPPAKHRKRVNTLIRALNKVKEKNARLKLQVIKLESDIARLKRGSKVDQTTKNRQDRERRAEEARSRRKAEGSDRDGKRTGQEQDDQEATSSRGMVLVEDPGTYGSSSGLDETVSTYDPTGEWDLPNDLDHERRLLAASLLDTIQQRKGVLPSDLLVVCSICRSEMHRETLQENAVVAAAVGDMNNYLKIQPKIITVERHIRTTLDSLEVTPSTRTTKLSRNQAAKQGARSSTKWGDI